MKKLFYIVLLTISFISLHPLTSQAKTAEFISSVVIPDNSKESKSLTGYRINGEQYVDLFTLAYVLADEPIHFRVSASNKTGTAYTIKRQHFFDEALFYAYPDSYSNKIFGTKKNVTLTIDGKKTTKKAYIINKKAYFSLKELGKLFNFSTQHKNKKILLKSGKNKRLVYAPGNTKTYASLEMKDVWATYGIKKVATMINNNDGTFSIFDGDALTYTSYDKHFKKLSTIKIKKELPLFGQFYSGKTYNYIAFGQENPKQKNIEVIRIVKYDKHFKRISEASIKGNAIRTVEPFRASGNGSIVEHDNILTFHTSKLRYASDDGINHQSQLTFKINTKTMKLIDDVEDFPWNHVSHSFDQYALLDNGLPVYLDLGDAYPRSIVLHKELEKINTTAYYDRCKGISDKDELSTCFDEVDEYVYTLLDEAYERLDSLEIFNISGKIGNNYTGVSIGGFDQSNTHFLIAFNSIDQSVKKNDTNNRNVYLYSTEKNLTKLKKTTLKSYANTKYTTTVPMLVKISDNKFIVLWNEYTIKNQTPIFNQMKYVYVNGKGEKISAIYNEPEIKLSTTKPLLMKNELWIPLNKEQYYVLQKLKLP